MIQLSPQLRICLHRKPVDFRRGIDGLCGLCTTLDREPFSGYLFVFTNRNRTGIKVLVYDGQGFWLCHKRLSRGRFRWWPVEGEDSSTELCSQELQALLVNINPSTLNLRNFREIKKP